MDKLNQRYILKPINLNSLELQPLDVPIANACAIKFVRFAKDQEGRYPQHYQHDFFQVAIDDSDHFFPFRPYDMMSIPPGTPRENRFHSLRYRNLRAVSGWAIIMICYEICPSGYGQRQDVTFPLKNMAAPEVHLAAKTGSTINVADGVTDTLFTVVVPAGQGIMLWDFEVWITPGQDKRWEVLVTFNTVSLKSYVRDTKTQNGPGFIAKHYNPPKEFFSTSVGSVNLQLQVSNLTAGPGSADFGGCMSYSLVPYMIQNPPAEADPFGG